MQRARLPTAYRDERAAEKALKTQGFEGGEKGCRFASLEGAPEAVKALVQSLMGTGAQMVHGVKEAMRPNPAAYARARGPTLEHT